MENILRGLIVVGAIALGALGVIVFMKLRPSAAADLAAIPSSVDGLTRVRAAECWQAEWFKPIRELILEAGPDALQKVDQEFGGVLGDLDAVSLVYFDTPTTDKATEPDPFVLLLATKNPINQGEFYARIAPKAVPNKEVIQVGTEALYARDRVIVIGSKAAVEKYLTRTASSSPASQQAVQWANSAPVNVVFRLGGMLLAERQPTSASDLRVVLAHQVSIYQLESLAKAEWLRLSFDPATGEMEVNIHFAKETEVPVGFATTKRFLDAVKEILAQQRIDVTRRGLYPTGPGQPRGMDLAAMLATVPYVGAIQQVEEWLTEAKVTQGAGVVTLKVKLPPAATVGAVTSALLVGSWQFDQRKRQEIRRHSAPLAYLGDLNLATFRWYQATNSIPPDFQARDGRPLLSWRVQLLPYLGHEELFKKFKPNEPWDSPNNLPLLSEMPEVFKLPGRSAPAHHTYWQRFIGPATCWERYSARPDLRRDFKDGTHNTFLIVEAADAVEWTKPADLYYAPGRPLPELSTYHDGGFLASFYDLSARCIHPGRVGEANLRAAITPNGGERLTQIWFD
jgi:hypothetical protein